MENTSILLEAGRRTAPRGYAGTGVARPGFRPLLAAALVLALAAGCSTPGPLHLYSVGPGAAEIHDATVGSSDVAGDVPSFLDPADSLVGFAYDPFTDHFFLRLAPGDHIRVVDRPARKIKRELTLKGSGTFDGSELAVSPRDGHLYLALTGGTQVVETTRFGEEVRRIALAGRKTPIAAIAYDQTGKELIALDADGRSLERFDLAGNSLARATLERPVTPSIAYDPDTRRLFAPLAGETGKVGAFDRSGRLVDTIAIAATDQFVDVGPHSFLRVF